MAFKFKRKESATEALRRLCADRVEAALGSIEECETLETVHAVRKETKKLRALLRLMRSGMRRRDFRAVMCDLKDAARKFGSARDAHVTFQALGIVTSHFKGQLGARPFADFRPALRRVCDEEEKRLRREHLTRRVSALLRRVRKRVESVSLPRKRWPVLAAGLQRTYRSGRKAWKLALADPSPENLHEWRKRVKELCYQLRLFCPMWPEQLEAAKDELKALGQYLGDDHDLFMMAQAAQKARNASSGELEILRGLIAERQNELRRAALALGARFYAEKPSIFCERLAYYWDAWCRRTAKACGKNRKLPNLKATV